jgi:hypothetical protein
MFCMSTFPPMKVNFLNYFIKNDWEVLKKRIEEMKAYDLISEKIEKIDCVGDGLRFLTNLGRLLGTIYLKNLQPNFLGKWQVNFDYQKNDCVYYQKNIFICLQNHRSLDLTFDCNNWQVFFI